MSQTIHDEAAYISESFGIPFTTALEITLANARRAAKITNTKNKKSSKRVDRR
ncbi:MAG TPA: hypothetical protein VGM57_04050 [Pseudolabrys sp.]